MIRGIVIGGESAIVSPIPIGAYTLPGDFVNGASATVTYNGTRWVMGVATVASIDFTIADVHTKYYVDYQTGDDTDTGLTPALAVKTLNRAVILAIALAAPAEIIIIDEWIGFLSVVATGYTFTDNIKIRSGSPSGRTLITQKRESYSGTFDWTDNGDGTFSSDTNQGDHSACLDNKFLDVYGGATPQLAAANASACIATPGSFFFDGVSTMRVHMQDAREPDEDWIYCSGLTAAKFATFMDKIDGTLIIENLTVYINNKTAVHPAFGGRCTFFTGANPNTAKLGVKNCLGYATSGDGFAFTDYKTTIFEDCVARYNRKDGLNYHSIAGVSLGNYINVYETRCQAYDQGWDGWKDQPARGTSDNGSTAHDRINILRVDCQYDRGYGPICADVGSCDSMNFGISAYRPNLNLADLPNSGASAADRSINACFYSDAVVDYSAPQRMYVVGCSGAELTDGDAAANIFSRERTITEIRVQYWQGSADPIVTFGEILDIDGNVLYSA